MFLNAIAFLQVSMSVRQVLTLSKYKKDDLYLTVQQDPVLDWLIHTDWYEEQHESLGDYVIMWGTNT